MQASDTAYHALSRRPKPVRPFLRHVLPFALALSAAITTTACGASSSTDGVPAGDAVEGDAQEFGTGPKLAYDEYTVLFTNPLCKPYDYPANQPPTN